MNASATVDSAHQLDQALPGMYVDIIRSGLSPRDARDARKVWGRCVSIAMSAIRRGWSEAQFVNEIARDESVLWEQLRARRGGGLKPAMGARRDLQKAWETAVVNLRDVGMRSTDDVRDDAIERAVQWVDRLCDGVDDLPDGQAAVMSYVIAQTQYRGMLRVTCPGREVAEFSKLSHQTAARTLRKLTDKGLLIIHYSGRGGPASTGRAAIYELADPDQLLLETSRRTPG